MKKTPNPPADKPKTAAPRRIEIAFSRLQARRARAKEAAQSERSAVFEKRLKNASARKAPLTRGTGGYYRFTKDFPEKAAETGLRENTGGAKKRRARRAALLAAALLITFCVSFCFAKAAWFNAVKRPPEADDTSSDAPVGTLTGCLHFTPEQTEGLTASSIAAALKAGNCSVAVLEYKEVYGRAYRDQKSLVLALHGEGYRAAAYVSCFKDSFHAAADPSMAVQTLNGSEPFWKDNSGSGWLNPFSAAARQLLLNTVAAAAEDGFDYVLLDHVCFPSDSGSTAAAYPGESDFTGTRNQLLTGFVNDAAAAAGSAVTVLMEKYTAFDSEAAADRPPCYGPLTDTRAGVLCADARFSVQQKNITVGTQKFSDAADIPFAFTLAVGELTAQNAGDARVLICVENGPAAEDCIKAAYYAGAAGYILW